MALAVSAWSGGLAGFLAPHWACGSALVAASGWVLARRARGHPSRVAFACLCVATAVGASGMLRAHANRNNPLAELAEQRAFVTITARIVADPMVRRGQFEHFVLVRARTEVVTGRGRTTDVRLPILVIAHMDWSEVELGSRVRLAGRLAPPDGADLAAVVTTARDPTLLEPPGGLFDAAAAVRRGIRTAVAERPVEQRSLIPALVVGDDQQMPADVVTAFQTCGLTHLLAVSGTNLTLVVGFLLIIARWVGVRARGLVLVGVVGVAGFVLLARLEPSVVRAAAMGSVALVGMGVGGRSRGVRALGVAVLLLLLLDPWLALSLGFVLSALATAGILFLAPHWRDCLMRWLPRWLAEVIAVPLAAQVACTPVVAALSEQVSLVAVGANLLAAPAVGPATVLGLVGGLVVLVFEPGGELVGRGAASCAWWIVSIAEHGADLPLAAVLWPAGAVPIAILTLLCLVTVAAMPRFLTSRWMSLSGAVLLVVVIIRPLPSPGWPPPGWVMVACDVGQGDGLVLNAGNGEVVVVDTGPDPALMDHCLDRLGVEEVSVVVLTHFHADHVNGLPGVLAGRSVGGIEVTDFPEPDDRAAAVAGWASAQGVPIRVPSYGEQRSLGGLTWQVIGPAGQFVGSRHQHEDEEGSASNNASVAMLAEVSDVRILLTGDMEPEAQQALESALPDLQVDVLKVPHHGSRYQDAGFMSGLGARLAVISAGAENVYGHPAPETIRLLEEAGMLVRRTDRAGDVAVCVYDGRLSVEGSRG